MIHATGYYKGTAQRKAVAGPKPRFIDKEIEFEVSGVGYTTDFPDFKKKIHYVRMNFVADGYEYSMAIELDKAEILGNAILAKVKEGRKREGK